MSIEGPGSVSPYITSSGENSSIQNKRGVAADPPSQSQKPESDTVTFTAAADTLRQLEQSIARLPVVDVRRVDRVHDALESNHYTVNPQNVADKMIDFETVLNRARA